MPQLGKPVAALTFGDQVPGPVIRARVGDRIKFSTTNRSDEVAPGMQIIAPSMMHSMDFHAAMVSPQDKYPTRVAREYVVIQREFYP